MSQEPTGPTPTPPTGGRGLPHQLTSALQTGADADLVRGLPGLMRVGVTAGWRALSWTVNTSVRTGSDVVRRALNGDPPGAIIAGVTADLRDLAARALGVDSETGDHGLLRPVAPLVKDIPVVRDMVRDLPTWPATDHDRVTGRAGGLPDNPTEEELLARGTELLRRSADVRVVEEGHPAYARILTELTPDEARILRYLHANGPQPSIDVRTFRPLGIGSEKVAGGLNMIAEHAGCRHVDRIHPYLTNLFRLGLIEFPREQVDNPGRYQLIEAQPKVAEVLARAGRMPKIVYRRIELNDFGTAFCEICLPPSGFSRNGRGLTRQTDGGAPSG